jgi:hypothetical protein
MAASQLLKETSAAASLERLDQQRMGRDEALLVLADIEVE